MTARTVHDPNRPAPSGPMTDTTPSGLLDLCPGPRTQQLLAARLGPPATRLDNPQTSRDATIDPWTSGTEAEALAAVRMCGDADLLADIARREPRTAILVAVAENPRTPMSTLRALPIVHGENWQVVEAATAALQHRMGAFSADDAVDTVCEVDLPVGVITAVCQRPDLQDRHVDQLLTSRRLPSGLALRALTTRDDLRAHPWMWRRLAAAGPQGLALCAMSVRLLGVTEYLETLVTEAAGWSRNDTSRYVTTAVRHLAAWPGWTPAEIALLCSLASLYGTDVWAELALSPTIPTTKLADAPANCIPAVLRWLAGNGGDDHHLLAAVLDQRDRVVTVAEAFKQARR